jgi:mono/diheme cytochrome c family protein
LTVIACLPIKEHAKIKDPSMGSEKRVTRLVASVVLALTAVAFFSAAPMRRAASQTPPQAEFKWQELGARVFGASCSVCHQENGQGIPGAFPPLAGHVAGQFAQRNGRDYLVRVVLFGLEGPISVNGATYASAMPPWPQLGDAEIAAALDHVLSAWGNDKLLPPDFTPILPSDVAAARGQRMTAVDVHALRREIVPATPGSAGDTAQTALTFTAEQAERGHEVYQRNCQDCHGTTLDNGEFGGAPLKGSYFRRRFGDGSVAALHSKTKSTMPPDRPGQLSDRSYVDLTAFLLSENGYAPGSKELPADLDAQQKMSMKK